MQKLSLRIKSARHLLSEKKLDAVLISSQANRYYLTGWQGDEESGFVLITTTNQFAITDSRYTEHAVLETKGFDVVEADQGVGPAFRKIAKSSNLVRIGFESHHLSVYALRRIKKFARGIKLIPTTGLIEALRSIKDEAEAVYISKAASIADEAFLHALTFVRPGKTEKEVAWELEKFMREKGAQSMAWSPFVVAAGKNSSMAHWGAADTKIKKGDMVLLDYGCVYGGYNCDISRVIFVSRPNIEQAGVYNLVLDAQKLGLSLVKEGRLGATIDKKVRNFLEKNTKYSYHHALGHGVGLEIHELPWVNARRKSRLVTGNVVTVEPGIYIPGWGGVRIEDLVLVTKKGCKALSTAPKQIKEVTI